MSNAITAIRGAALTYTGDPFQEPIEDCVVYESDALIVMNGGLVTHFGDAATLLGTLPEGVEVRRYPESLILPGFIDCHVHYPQIDVIGSHGEQLLEWLDKYTFPAEMRYADKAHARTAARLFLDECLKAGTTTAAVFCTVDPQSVDMFFEASAELNMRNIAGKVLMDRNAPPDLLDTAQSGYDQSKALIERWHGKGRALYAITPRFAATSTEEQMAAAGALWAEYPGTYLQSHVSENLAEIQLVKSLYPSLPSYVEVYHHYGHLGPRSIFGHGIHLSEAEYQRLAETGTALAHCPTSNLFLGSGLFNFAKAADRSRPVRVGLATDIGGGTHFSQLVSMNEAYKIARLGGGILSAHQALYLATRGAARALYLEDRIGSLTPGMEADLTVLNLRATPLLAYRLGQAENLEDLLFALIMLGDDRVTAATYLSGDLAYEA